MIINELLIPENFIRAKKRFESSPEHLLIFENKGFTRSEILNANIGLTEDGRLYTPILIKDMTSCGVFFIMPSLSMGSFEKINDTVQGFIGRIDQRKSKTLVIVRTIAELLFLRFRSEYENVVLIPDGVHVSFFAGMDEIILLHYDIDLISQIGRDVNCFFLENDYEGEPLGIPQVVSIRDISDIFQNPFLINGELYFDMYNGKHYITSYSKTYECRKTEGGIFFNHESGSYYTNVDALQLKTTRFNVTTEEAFKALYEYIKKLNVYINPQEAEAIAYFIMYCWVYPHFGNSIFNLNLFFQSGVLMRYAINAFKWVMPSTRICSFSLPSVYFSLDEGRIPYSVPSLGVFKTNISSMYAEGMPLLITAELPIRKGEFEVGMGTKTKSILFNWALGFKKEKQIRIKDKQTPYLDPLGWIVLKEEDLGRIRSVIESSSILLKDIQKGKDFEHNLIIY